MNHPVSLLFNSTGRRWMNWPFSGNGLLQKTPGVQWTERLAASVAVVEQNRKTAAAQTTGQKTGFLKKAVPHTYLTIISH